MLADRSKHVSLDREVDCSFRHCGTYIMNYLIMHVLLLFLIYKSRLHVCLDSVFTLQLIHVFFHGDHTQIYATVHSDPCESTVFSRSCISAALINRSLAKIGGELISECVFPSIELH